MGPLNEDLTLNPLPEARHLKRSMTVLPSERMAAPVCIRLLIVADYPVVRHGLRQIFGGAMDIHIVEEASSEGDVIRRVTACDPDVVLIDFAGKNSYRLFCRLQKQHRHVSLLIFSAAHDRYAYKAFQHGAAGYVTKDQVPDHLVLAVRKIVRGEKYTFQKMVPGLREQLKSFKSALLSSLSRMYELTASSPPERPPLHR